jgi:hypothetical protein
VRIAARLTDLPHRGALAEPGSLPDPYPYELCVRRRAPARALAVLYELFTSSDYLGTGTTRAVSSDGPDHVLKVPLGAQGADANTREAQGFRGTVACPVAPCELVMNPLLSVRMPLLRMAVGDHPDRA